MTEVLVSPQGQKPNLQSHGRKLLSNGSHKDMWLVVREGSLAEVDVALAQLKKNGGNINSRNTFGLTPLHIATWRNNIPIVRRLLAAGADPDARDGESGWSSLHRALHFGHLAVANILLQSGASVTLEDSKSRTPIDLLSGPVSQVTGTGQDSVATELFSWGSGVNYQLGTGNAHIQKLPCKIDSLHGSFIKFVSAAKFHSVAVSARGEVFTWGFGRGGRLGHPEFDIHSGQAAVITPRQVTSGLGSRRVKAIAAAKHHTVIATEGGEVFTWGSNREGQLGYTSVDTQPTPRRVGSMKPKIIAVAAANKHTAVVSESGEVFTWGCNREGQLGYGTSNSASNYTPRLVEYLKGKFFAKVAAAKYHTIVLGADGEIFTWGHRLVTPRRVVIARNIKKSGGTTLKFHRMERLHVVAIAAGMVHSTALTDDGALFYWLSSDSDPKCQQIYSLCGGSVVSISAGKFWTAAATTTGDVYMIDGKKDKDKRPVATRVHGVKRATSVSVGETHLLIVSSLYHPMFPHNMSQDHPQKPKLNLSDEVEELDEDFDEDDQKDVLVLPTVQKDEEVPSLKSLCEKVAAEHLVEPRNSVQLLEVADSLGADDLRKHCEDIAIRNLDYIFAVASHTIASALPDIAANLEKSLDHRSSEPWCYRRLPTPTATFPAVIYSEEEDSESEVLKTREKHMKNSNFESEGDQRVDSFLKPRDDLSNGVSKQVRALRKKLQQIEMLEEMQSNGLLLDDQQIAKLNTRLSLESSLAELGLPVAPSLCSSDTKGNKKSEGSRKERRKSKKRLSQVETVSGSSELNPKDFLTIEVPQDTNIKGEDAIYDVSSPDSPNSGFSFKKKVKSESSKSKSSVPKPASKKKNKKGGLSMFLSGALDDPPKEETPPPPPAPKSEGPAWGGAKILKGNASLREILNEESKVKGYKPTKGKDQIEDHTSNGKSDGKIPLSSFLPSNPIPVVSARAPRPPDTETTPPWASSATPPHPFCPSLRDIQIQQVKQHHNHSQTPKTRTAGFSIASGQVSPADPAGVNRWFKPEIDTPSSLRSIQIEEKAMKDLKRLYSNVKVVKNQS